MPGELDLQTGPHAFPEVGTSFHRGSNPPCLPRGRQPNQWLGTWAEWGGATRLQLWPRHFPGEQTSYLGNSFPILWLRACDVPAGVLGRCNQVTFVRCLIEDLGCNNRYLIMSPSHNGQELAFWAKDPSLKWCQRLCRALNEIMFDI